MKTSRWNILFVVLLGLVFAIFGSVSVYGAGLPRGQNSAGVDVTETANTETAGNNLSFPVIWAEGVAKTLRGTAGEAPVLEGEWWYQWGTNGVDPAVTPASCPPDPDDSDTINPHGFPLCDNEVEGTVNLPEEQCPILDPDNNEYCDNEVEGTVDTDLEACAVDPDNINDEKFCDDGNPGTVGFVEGVAGYPRADNPLPLAKAYLQKDPDNVWQASSMDWSNAPVNVDRIDWSDSLESVDWYTRSQVRLEVVLLEDLATPMIEYEMRHTSGWGINEVHGLATEPDGTVLYGPGDQATVYSPCARLTIQKLLVDRDDPLVADLTWNPNYYEDCDAEGTCVVCEEGENCVLSPRWEGTEIHPPIFNKAVYNAGDGPEYYSAEINVKGRIIYGYTWNVRELNDDTPVVANDNTAAGDYRVTLSFDEICGTVNLNTFFVDGTTNIMLPLEVAALPIPEPQEGDETNNETGGGVAELDFANNLTYMDVRILERGGGGGGGGNGGKPDK